MFLKWSNLMVYIWQSCFVNTESIKRDPWPLLCISADRKVNIVTCACLSGVIRVVVDRLWMTSSDPCPLIGRLLVCSSAGHSPAGPSLPLRKLDLFLQQHLSLGDVGMLLISCSIYIWCILWMKPIILVPCCIIWAMGILEKLCFVDGVHVCAAHSAAERHLLHDERENGTSHS